MEAHGAMGTINKYQLQSTGEFHFYSYSYLPPYLSLLSILISHSQFIYDEIFPFGEYMRTLAISNAFVRY